MRRYGSNPHVLNIFELHPTLHYMILHKSMRFLSLHILSNNKLIHLETIDRLALLYACFNSIIVGINVSGTYCPPYSPKNLIHLLQFVYYTYYNSPFTCCITVNILFCLSYHPFQYCLKCHNLSDSTSMFQFVLSYQRQYLQQLKTV